MIDLLTTLSVKINFNIYWCYCSLEKDQCWCEFSWTYFITRGALSLCITLIVSLKKNIVDQLLAILKDWCLTNLQSYFFEVPLDKLIFLFSFCWELNKQAQTNLGSIFLKPKICKDIYLHSRRGTNTLTKNPFFRGLYQINMTAVLWCLSPWL